MTVPYPVVRGEELYRGRVVTLRRDVVQMPDGVEAVREIVLHPGAVGIVAIDDEERVVLVNQYRHPVGRNLDELPAGLLDVAGEPALLAAQRELAEEARLQAGRWDVLLDLLPSPGFSAEAIRIYLARELSDAVAEGFVAAHEEILMTVERVPLGECVRRALQGEISNAAAVAGVLAAEVSRQSGWSGLRPAEAPWLDRPEAAGQA
ncbi:NUDIX hydrolase [Jatrophihabitans sp.]|uniref:NUDIX hydrolase n=1 Tax=Jatrophihabitans sp. TaxID=1932789 RepID=UPI0030C73FB9|nr:hydrolase [Jatrophihabitans sp.]